MELTTLNILIDDIMLSMRYNSISESEQYSRRQIENWIMEHRAFILKSITDAGRKPSGAFYQEFSVELIPNAKVKVGSMNVMDLVSVDPIPEPFANVVGDMFIGSRDEFGNNIQIMGENRSRINRFSRHFFSSRPTAYISRKDNKYHIDNEAHLRFITIFGIFTDPASVPGFDADKPFPIDRAIIPEIKKRIFEINIKHPLTIDTQNDSADVYQRHGLQQKGN